MWNVLTTEAPKTQVNSGFPTYGNFGDSRNERSVVTNERIAPVLPLFGDVYVDDSLLAWQDRALCAQTDPEAFFPEKGGSTREAKKVCSGCEVRSECLDYALANDERFGIWGGLSERERRRLKKAAV
jgi:WhiB family redox-sensing transcriptional regulator